MRLIAPMVVVLALSACAASYSSMDPGEQSAARPALGNDAARDGFYDGGIFDPDWTRRNLALPE